jgi:tetratricopeptide (TPR) repeat protein
LRRAALAAALLALGGAGCPGGSAPGPGGAGGRATDARSLVDEGRFDEALAALGEASDAESLFQRGRAWAGKAASAPVPTPLPGEAEGGPVLKREELQALELLERAVAARPDHAGAHLLIADVLAPYALARGEADRRRPTSPPAAGAQADADRVLRHYADAMQADPGGTHAAERLAAFATTAGRLAEADAGFQELLRRRREDPGLLVRYGDFLAGARGNPEGALAQYAQALMWRSDDRATRLKMADIYLGKAAEHVARREYAAAEQRVRDARRLGFDTDSPQGQRMRDLESQLRDIRGR